MPLPQIRLAVDVRLFAALLLAFQCFKGAEERTLYCGLIARKQEQGIGAEFFLCERPAPGGQPCLSECFLYVSRNFYEGLAGQTGCPQATARASACS